MPTARAGTPMIAAIGPLRSASRVMAIPMKARMLIHHGTRHRPKIAMRAHEHEQWDVRRIVEVG